LAVLVVALSGCGDPGDQPLSDATGIAESALCSDDARSTTGALLAWRHTVPVRDGAWLELRERRPPAAWARQPRRAVLMLHGALSHAGQYDAPGDSPLDRMARAGFFAFALSYEGEGRSSPTADGAGLTPERLAQQVGDVVEWIRRARGVASVDLLGSSLGSSLAVILGSTESPIDRRHVGRLVLTALVHRSTTPALRQALPAPVADAADPSSSGFVTTDAATYAPVLRRASPPIARWLGHVLAGRHPVGPVEAASRLPLFRAEDGRAPALLVWSDDDPLMAREDVASFEETYGAPLQAVALPGSGHVPYYEAVREAFWGEVLSFLGARDHMVTGGVP